MTTHAQPSRAQHAPTAADQEVRIGGTPAAQAANAALLALARAARSFTLYDAKNEAVRALIADFREKTRRALDGFGALVFEVRPFEFALGGEVVYHEQDREKSLAFRLFRDGVRGLTLAPETDWDDLVHLLEILSIRYSGVRQQEDDLVTLLRKTAFKGLSFVAVEGFVPDEECPEPPVEDDQLDLERHAVVPPDWDLPLPAFEQMGALQFRALPAELLDRLQNEETTATTARAAVRTVHELVQTKAADREAVLSFAAEVRDFLVVEKRADALLEMGRELLPMLSDPACAKAVHDCCLSEAALRMIVGAQPANVELIPAPLESLLLLDAVADTRALAQVLVEELQGVHEKLVRRLLAVAGKGAPQVIAELAADAPAVHKVALLSVLCDIDPERAIAAAVEFCPRADPAAQAQLLHMLAQMVFTPEIAALAKQLLDSPAAEVRLATVELLATNGGQRAYPLLHAFLEKRADKGFVADEAEAAGRAMGHLSPRAAIQTFKAWIEPANKGLFSKLIGQSINRMLGWAAVAGLEGVVGPAGIDADALLQKVAARGDAELRQYASDMLARRRRRMAGGASSAQ